ncbi:MAG TPA: HDIG domain-containing metalloprotein [Tepidiformaceae bacterium]
MLRRRPAPLVSPARAAVFGLLLALLVAPFVIPIIPGGQSLNEGNTAPRTLVAAHGAQYQSAALTTVAQDEAARTVADVPLPVDPLIRQQQTDKLDKLLDAVRTIRQTNETDQQRFVDLGNLPAAAALSSLGRTQLLNVDRTTFDDLQVRADKALLDIFQRPIQQNEILTRIDEYLGQTANQTPTGPELTALREALRVFVVPNFQVDIAATQKRRDDARQNVSPVIVTYTRGQVIAGEAQRLSAADIEALRQTGVLSGTYNWYRVGAGALVTAAFGFLMAAAVFEMQPFRTRSRALMLVTGGLLVLLVLGFRLSMPLLTPDLNQHFFQFALPLAAAAMVAAVFTSLEFAIVVAVAVGLLAAFVDAAAPQLAGSSFIGSMESMEIVAAYAASGIAGAFVVHRAERVSRFLLAAFAVAITLALPLVVFWLINEPRPRESLGWIAIAAAINGLGSTLVLAVLALPLGRLAGLTTRFELARLADERHPLLRRLEEEAPGTYHHSLMVGTLAERAASRIGADALVARAGAYYHDIGKLAHPGLYIENMLDGAPNPHDSLLPEESTIAIRGHVTSGLEIAAAYHLPAVIRDFIPQHHGTRLVAYFYRQAGSPESAAARDQFQYRGPRPQTKEAAIVMLADSCEAAVRARRVDGAAAVDGFVDDIVRERLRERQLDECDITLSELGEVADSLKATLRAVYHPRVAYPEASVDEIARLAEDFAP